ncbi:MAG: hypothetical protein CVV42_14160 [Candidatus Riflebacteria bacterium HGW-Riflebacteria-2]|jgi:hypothetical protein|nr:MAG: hypothetical protein CVV42_14160 [Candidatus Riflebacteria bacterium HGW-Riflebacteria-2]
MFQTDRYVVTICDQFKNRWSKKLAIVLSKTDKMSGMKAKRFLNILVILAVFTGLMVVLQDRLIFFPGAWPAGFTLPEKLENCTLTQVTLQTPDGLKLDALLAQSTTPATLHKTVLFSHGNAGNLLHRAGKIDKMCKAGFDVFIYDYRGYGRSEGSPTVAGAISDGKTALQWLLDAKKINREDIVLYGESLGTGVAAEIYRESKAQFAALVHESGFASLSVMAGRRIPLIGSFILKRDLPTSETIKNYHGRLLVIHSRKDEVIPYSDSEMLYNICPSKNKTLYTIETAGHNSPVWDDPAWLKRWQQLMQDLQHPISSE